MSSDTHGVTPIGRGAWASYLDEDLEKSEFEIVGNIAKLEPDIHLVFGFFSIVSINGKLIEDTQGDRISAEVLEESAYDFVLNARTGGDMHGTDSTTGLVRGVGRLVESIVFTEEKQAAMRAALQSQGVDAELDLKCVCWWGGFKIDSEDTWKRITTGELRAFSIGGRGKRDKIE